MAVRRHGARAVGAAVLAWLAALAFLSAPPAVAAASAGQAFVPGQVLVRFEASADAAMRSAVRRDERAELARRLPVRGLQLLELPPGASVDSAVRRLEREDGVLYAEPNYYRSLRALPNEDPALLERLWGLHNIGQRTPGTSGRELAGSADADIDAPEAWDLTTGSPAVTVAVGDSGIAADHPDLAPNIGPGGYDFMTRREGVLEDRDPWFGHGTHVAGIIGARGNNGQFLVGVNWTVSLMPLAIGLSQTTAATWAESFAYAGARAARVYNGSFGMDKPARSELDALQAAAGTLFVFPADNGGGDKRGDNSDAVGDFPCKYPLPNVICVAASDRDDRLAPFSNYGPTTVHLAAPGVDVWSTVPPDRGAPMAVQSGTSMAAPHVAGVAALYLARYPYASVADVRNALLGGADRKPGLAGKLVTGGRVNAAGTLAIPPATPPPAPAPVVAAGGRSAPAADTSAPAGALRVRTRQRLRRVVARGLRGRADCSEPCRLTLTLRLDRRTARRLGLPVIVGRRQASAQTAGELGVRVRISRAAARRLTRLRRVRLVLHAEVADPAGNRTTLVRKLTLTR